jgi:hypothetical protein
MLKFDWQKKSDSKFFCYFSNWLNSYISLTINSNFYGFSEKTHHLLPVLLAPYSALTAADHTLSCRFEVSAGVLVSVANHSVAEFQPRQPRMNRLEAAGPMRNLPELAEAVLQDWNLQFWKSKCKSTWCLLPEVLSNSYFRESGCEYTRWKAGEKLTARRDKYFIIKCPHVLLNMQKFAIFGEIF